MLPFLKEHFVECSGSLTIIMEDWDKRKVHLFQVGEKVIQLDDWQKERLTQMVAQLQHQELENNLEDTLAKLYVVFQ